MPEGEVYELNLQHFTQSELLAIWEVGDTSSLHFWIAELKHLNFKKNPDEKYFFKNFKIDFEKKSVTIFEQIFLKKNHDFFFKLNFKKFEKKNRPDFFKSSSAWAQLSKNED